MTHALTLILKGFRKMVTEHKKYEGRAREQKYQPASIEGKAKMKLDNEYYVEYEIIEGMIK